MLEPNVFIEVAENSGHSGVFIFISAQHLQNIETIVKFVPIWTVAKSVHIN